MQRSIFAQLLSSCVEKSTDNPMFVYNKVVKKKRAWAYVKSQKQAIHVMLKCANNYSEWLVPPVWCHPTDERLLAAVRMYAVLSVNASQRRAIDSLPGGKHTISGREQTYWISTSSPSSASTLRWWVFRSHSPFPFYFSSNASFFWGGFTVLLSLTRRWQRNQFGELLKNPNTAAILEQDLLRLDMNSAEQTVTWLITLGVLESPKKTISDPEAFLQSSLKDGVVLCRLLERLSPGTTEKVRTLKHPPPPPPCLPNAYNQPPAPSARLCAAGPWKPTRFVVWLLFLPTGPWGDFLL